MFITSIEVTTPEPRMISNKKGAASLIGLRYKHSSSSWSGLSSSSPWPSLWSPLPQLTQKPTSVLTSSGLHSSVAASACPRVAPVQNPRPWKLTRSLRRPRSWSRWSGRCSPQTPGRAALISSELPGCGTEHASVSLREARAENK